MTRVKRRSSRRLGFVVIMLSGGLLAVVIGYFLGTFAMQAFLTGVDHEPTSPPTTETPKQEPPDGDNGVDIVDRSFTLPAVTLYRLQVGAFSSRDNALDLASALRQDGIHPYVGTEPPYRVVAAVASDDDAVSALIPTIEQRGYPVYVGEWTLPVGPFTVRGDEDCLEWFEHALVSLAGVISRQSVFWTEILTGQSVEDAAFVELETEARQLQTEVSAQIVVADWADRHDQLRNVSQLAVQSVFAMRAVTTDNWESAMGLLLELIGGYEVLCAEIGAQQ